MCGLPIYVSTPPGGQEVAGSSPVAPIDVNPAEIVAYDYLPMCRAAVTSAIARVVLLVFQE